MEFTRKRIVGKQQRTYKEWRSETDDYRIVWRSQFMGLELDPCFYATVRINGPSGDYWNFVGRRGPYKTLAKAQDACLRHQKAWLALEQLADSDRKGRADRIRALDDRARGTSRDGDYRLLMTVPAWMEGKISPFILAILWPKRCEQECDPESLTPVSEPSAIITTPDPSEEISDSLAFSVGDSPVSTLPTPKRRKVKTDAAPPAAEPAEAQKPKRKRNIGKPSKRGEKTVLAMTA